MGLLSDLKIRIVDGISSSIIGSISQRGPKGAQSVEVVDADGDQIIPLQDDPAFGSVQSYLSQMIEQITKLLPGSYNLKTIRKTLSASAIVIAGVAGQKIYLTSLTISCDAALTVEISWDASPTDDEVIEGGYFAAKGGLHADYGLVNTVTSEAGEGLYCTITGTGNTKISAKYYQE